MHEARHHLPLYTSHQPPPHVAPNQAMASSSSSSSHGHQQQQHQQQQSFHQQLRQQPPPLSHGLNSSARGPSPPHPHGGVPPHLPISGSSVSYSDDNTGGGGGSSFGMLNMQASFDDSSSHLDLPSLLQANGNNGGRDVRLGMGLDHHHQQHYNHHQHHHQHQQHHHQHSSWSSHAVDPLPPVARLPENKPQELPSPDGSPEVSQHSSTTSTGATKKRGAGDMSALGGVGHHQAAPSQQHFASAGDEAPKPARAKKKKVEKNSNALPLDDNDLLDDEFGDGLDCEVGDGGGGGGKDVKRQMRLVKNRQAAQQFRKRQKLYIQDLERRCTTLTAQNASYAAKVELLSTENRLVKEQLEYLRSFVSQAVQVSLTPAAVAGGPLQMPGPLSAALAGAIPAPLLGIGSPLAGALSSHHPSQTGPGRPAFAPLQPHPTTGGNGGGGGGGGGGSHLGAKMPSFPSPVSLAPASSSAPRSSAYGGGASSSAYARGASSSLTSDHHHHHHRPL